MTFSAASGAATTVRPSALGRVDGAARRLLGAALTGPRPRYVGKLLALILLYSGAAQLSFRLEFAGPVAAIVWLPVGVGIAFLYLGGLGLFPGVLIGDLLVNDYGALPTLSAAGQSVGNLLEVVIAVVLIQRLVRRGSPLDTITGTAGLLLAIAAGTALSATIGTASLWLGSVLTSDTILSTWRTWWMGDTTGALVVVPVAIAWRTPPPLAMTARRAGEAIALFTAIAVVSEVSSRSDRPVMYVVFPLLMWAALRFGRRGATLAVTITVGLTIGNATTYLGPFAAAMPSLSVTDIQLFVGVATVSTLLLAAVVSERDRFTRELAASRVRILEAGQRERLRLERNLHDGAQHRMIWLAADLGRAAEVAREHPSEAPALLEHAEQQLRTALEELRELAHGIHPTVLADLGLAAAIRTMALRSTCPMRVGDLPPVRLDITAEATAYYVVAEAVANAEKHAGASVIRVSATTDDRALRVDVADDGAGGAAERGYGLQGLRDRVEGVGGRLRVHSPPGLGTRITATIPLAGSPRSRPDTVQPERG